MSQDAMPQFRSCCATPRRVHDRFKIQVHDVHGHPSLKLRVGPSKPTGDGPPGIQTGELGTHERRAGLAAQVVGIELEHRYPRIPPPVEHEEPPISDQAGKLSEFATLVLLE